MCMVLSVLDVPVVLVTPAAGKSSTSTHLTSTHGACCSPACWHHTGESQPPPELSRPMRQVSGLRYGENPHQPAAFYSDLSLAEHGHGGIATAQLHHGKEVCASACNAGAASAAAMLCHLSILHVAAQYTEVPRYFNCCITCTVCKSFVEVFLCCCCMLVHI